MGARKPELAEPVVVDQFWANRRHDAIITELSTYQGHNLINVRKHAMHRDGKLKPTPKGIAIKVTRLPDLAKAINKALAKAQELGLLDASNTE
ncbi:transcriptional coactivator p15/PC4 family protein [Bradyrhizobium sp. 160]|uniref:transcriptional coactivator p15/PC4 family protein n=1 Tax=unclassified Bradyrhizobium TaxID=2631580 RepID=UPI001FF9536A|nr:MULTISPECIES: transcriptional coactivator p15/PC4 family protein [unclassified Bradyrhizobium]MCK1540651.1 transcriptional coactivator p15/PC4 family protein [Bradyrhizobium sp. 179]MCK1627410.1 transcriptional coactivator p15/PC4 family protein [Bradyrhizobium sp. 160]